MLRLSDHGMLSHTRDTITNVPTQDLGKIMEKGMRRIWNPEDAGRWLWNHDFQLWDLTAALSNSQKLRLTVWGWIYHYPVMEKGGFIVPNSKDLYTTRVEGGRGIFLGWYVHLGACACIRKLLTTSSMQY